MTKTRQYASLLLALAFVCASALPAYAQWAVTDAGAYGYYAQQIQKMAEEIEAVKAQTVGQFQRLEDIKSQVSGQFAGLKQVYTQLNGIKQTFDVKPTNLLAEAQKWTKLKDLVGGYTGIDGILNDTFKDPRTLDPKINRMAYLNRQYNMRQSALKSSISHADQLLQTIPERLENINALQEAASQAQGSFAKQDMTNAILIEILRTLTTFSGVLLEFNQAASLMNFTGVDESVTKSREAQIWGVKAKTEAVAKSLASQNEPAGMGMSTKYVF